MVILCLNSDENDGRSLYAAISALNRMIEHPELGKYEVAKIKCDDGVERDAIEVPFRIVVKNFSLSDEEYIPVWYEGFIDGIFYHIMREHYFVQDIKTHRRNLYKTEAMYEFKDQFIPYGLVINHIQGLPAFSLELVVVSVYIDILKASVTPFTLMKTQQDLMDWATLFYDDLMRIKKWFKRGYFPRRGDACTQWNRACGMFDICKFRDQPDLIKQHLELTTKDEWERPEPWIVVELDLGI